MSLNPSAAFSLRDFIRIDVRKASVRGTGTVLHLSFPPERSRGNINKHTVHNRPINPALSLFNDSLMTKNRTVNVLFSENKY